MTARPLGSKHRLGPYLPQTSNSTSKYGMSTRSRSRLGSGPVQGRFGAYIGILCNSFHTHSHMTSIPYHLPIYLTRVLAPLPAYFLVSATIHSKTPNESPAPSFLLKASRHFMICPSPPLPLIRSALPPCAGLPISAVAILSSRSAIP
jgi:hypothetical protein